MAKQEVSAWRSALRALDEVTAPRAPIPPAQVWRRAVEHLVSTTPARVVDSQASAQWRRDPNTWVSVAVLSHGVHVEIHVGWFENSRRSRMSELVLKSSVTAYLPMSLELGLRIRPGRSTSAELGDSVLESRYFLHAHEPEQLRAILTDPIRAALRSAWGSATVRLTDRSVEVERLGHVDEAFAVWAIHDSAWLARALVDAAAHVPVSPRLRPYLPAMKQVAAHTGLAFTTTPLGMRGLLRGIDVALTAFRDESTDQPGLRLQAAFPQPLGFGLHLRPTEDGTFGFLRPRDVQIGDRLLDDKLDIHATDTHGVQAVFDAKARAMLHHLRDRGRVYIDDHTVSLESRGSVHPQDLLPTLHSVRDFAALLSEAARVRRTGTAR